MNELDDLTDSGRRIPERTLEKEEEKMAKEEEKVEEEEVEEVLTRDESD